MLHDLLKQLGEAFSEHGVENAIARAASGQLLPLPRVSEEDTLVIYQNSIEGQLLDALREIFPVAAALVGEDCFLTITRLYAQRHPTHQPDLSQCGSAFPRFLAELDFLKRVPYLPDMARLELAWHLAFTAPDPDKNLDPEIAAEALGQYPENWRFLLPPSAHCIASPYPLLAIWDAHQKSIRCNEELEIDFEENGDRLLIWRDGLDMRIDPIEPELWPILEAIALGQSVAELLELGMPVPETIQDEIEELEASDFQPILNSLQALFSRKWISGCEKVFKKPVSHSTHLHRNF